MDKNELLYIFVFLIDLITMYYCILPKEVKTDKDGYQAIALVYHSIKFQDDLDVTIDFSKCISFDANLSAVLGAVLDLLILEKGYRIWFSPANRSVRRRLSRNNFFRAWNVETITEDREHYITYQKFPRENSIEFKEYIEKELLQKQKFPRHTKLVGTRITENIFEIYANAIMHGHTEYVHSCGEYNNNIHTLDMTIVDCGLTIPHNVNTYLHRIGKDQLSSCKAIEWAFVDGHTTKSSPGGLGLAILKQFIEKNRGCLQIVSGDAFLEYSLSGTKSQLLKQSFPGTIVNVKFNFDDDKKYLMESEKNTFDINDLL